MRGPRNSLVMFICGSQGGPCVSVRTLGVLRDLGRETGKGAQGPWYVGLRGFTPRSPSLTLWASVQIPTLDAIPDATVISCRFLTEHLLCARPHVQYTQSSLSLDSVSQIHPLTKIYV